MSLSIFSFLGHPRADLSAFIDGQLSTERTAAVDAHVSRCASCRAEVDGLLETRAMLATLPQANAPRSFALTPQQVAQPARPSLQRPQPVAPAFFGMRIASAGLAVALALVFVADLGDGGSNNDAVRSVEDAGLTQMSVAEDGTGGDSAEGDFAQPGDDQDMKDETDVPAVGSEVPPDATAAAGLSVGGPASYGSETPATAEDAIPTPIPTPTPAYGGPYASRDLPSESPVVADIPTGSDGQQNYSGNEPTTELAQDRVATDPLTGDNDDGLSALQIAEIILAATLAVAVAGGFLLPLALRRNR